MPKTYEERTRRRGWWLPWLLVVAWVYFIWAHSLVPGVSSDQESLRYVDLVRGFVYELSMHKGALLDRLLTEHPGIVTLLADTHRLNVLIRKTAHFMEYFVLGTLVFWASSRSFRRFPSAALAVSVLWVGAPSVDEFIQLHVPMRSGQLSDVLLDMCGFAGALVVCGIIWGLAKLIGGMAAALTHSRE